MKVSVKEIRGKTSEEAEAICWSKLSESKKENFLKVGGN